jgi:cation diffusion facilitator family transporter
VASGFAMYSIIYAARHKDDDHPYGHGKMEYVSVGFEGALIFITGIVVIIESIINLLQKHHIDKVDFGLMLTAISSLILFAMGSFLKKRGKKLNSEVLTADGKHLITDVITSLGIIIGLVVYKFTGYFWIDSVVAMLLALHIMFSGYKLIKQSLDTLLDKADVATIEKIALVLQQKRNKEWIDIHNLRLQKFGNNLHVDCHVTMPFYEPLDKIHAEIKILEKELNMEFDNPVEFFIHADPCMQLSCSICQVDNCAFRKNSFVREVKWNAGNLMLNKRHQVEDPSN